METAQQKAVREAYKEHWDIVKDFVDENGWCLKRRNVNFELIQKLGLEYNKGKNSYQFRPKSLQGIETNNGWTRIESESDLPKEDVDVFFIVKEGIIVEPETKDGYLIGHFHSTKHTKLKMFNSSRNGSWNHTQVAYYKIITKPKPPIY